MFLPPRGSTVGYEAHNSVEGGWPDKSWDFATKFQSSNVAHNCPSEHKSFRAEVRLLETLNITITLTFWNLCEMTQCMCLDPFLKESDLVLLSPRNEIKTVRHKNPDGSHFGIERSRYTMEGPLQVT